MRHSATMSKEKNLNLIGKCGCFQRWIVIYSVNISLVALLLSILLYMTSVVYDRKNPMTWLEGQRTMEHKFIVTVLPLPSDAATGLYRAFIEWEFSFQMKAGYKACSSVNLQLPTVATNMGVSRQWLRQQCLVTFLNHFGKQMIFQYRWIIWYTHVTLHIYTNKSYTVNR